MAIAQIAFIEERINENVINCLSDIYNKTSDFHVLLYLVYCKLSAKNNFYNNDPNLINEVYIMMNTKNICYTSKYAVYQIFKLFSSTRSEFLPIPTLNDFIDRIHKYLCKSDNFWTLMIEGRVATAARLNYELGHELHLLKEEFRILESFYPNNPTILHYKKSFFFDDTNSTINSNLPLNKNSTQSVSNAASTKVSNSSSNQSIQFKEVTNPEINLKSSTNSDISTYDEQIMRNIKNMLKINYSPLYIYLYLVFTVIFLAVAFCYLTYPFISLKDALSNTSIIPIFIKPTINIIHNWMKLTLCDHYLSHSPNYSFVSNDTVQVWNLKNLTDLDQMFVYLKKDRLKNLAHTQENVTQFMHLFTQWSSIQSINPLKTIWLESSIPYFPGANDNAMKDILIDLHSLLFYITSQLKINDVDEYGIPFNSFIYHNDIFRRHFNLSISVSLKLLDSLYAMENIIDDSRKLLSNDFLIINCAIFFSFLIPIIGIIHYFTCKHLYNFIVYHFRPSSHPNSTKFNDLKRTNKIEPFTTSKSTIKLIIALFLMSIVYIIQYYILWIDAFNEFNIFLYDCSATITSQESIVTASLSYLSLIEGIYQEKYIQIANLYIMKLDNYSNHLIYQMTKTGNQEQKYSWILNNFIFKDLSSLITDNINWPVLKSLQMFSFYYTKFLVNGVYSSQHFYILEMQKLLITILLDGIFEYSTTFNALADMRLNETRSIINIELIITASIFIIFSSIIISFYRGFDQFDDAIEQRFLSLSPFFIANNTCLTEYAVKMIEKDKVSKTITSYLDLFETCNISLLILSDKQTILGFTQPLQILFGYKYEQLIQQNIEIIFPKIQNNEELLYKRFNHYINHKVTPENDELNGVVLKGRCSDNSPISLNVFLRSVHENGNQYFVMEIHPITEEVSCLEIIKSHQELTKEFEKMALPVHLFPGIENSQYPITHEFKNCALVLIYSYLNDAVSGNIDYSEIGMHKSIKEMSANYLFNCRNSIILSSTHDSFIVLFFDETENELKYENENDTNDKTYNEIEKSSNRRHLDNTLNFINEYTHISNFSVSCVVLEDENIKVTINPSPSKNKNIQDQLKLRIPSMTIEPHTTKIKELVDISFLMIPNCILTTKDTVLKMGAMENAIPVNNDICQDLYHVRLF